PALSLVQCWRARRHTIVVLTAKVIARLSALVTVLYMIRQLSVGNYGWFNVLVNFTAIVSVVLDLRFNVLFVREATRHHSEIQRYLRNVMSIRLLMSALSFVLLAAVLYSIGLPGLLVTG